MTPFLPREYIELVARKHCHNRIWETPAYTEKQLVQMALKIGNDLLEQSKAKSQYWANIPMVDDPDFIGDSDTMYPNNTRHFWGHFEEKENGK